MRPGKPETPNGDLFRASLEAILDPAHELIRLWSVAIDRMATLSPFCRDRIHL